MNADEAKTLATAFPLKNALERIAARAAKGDHYVRVYVPAGREDVVDSLTELGYRVKVMSEALQYTDITLDIRWD